MIKINIPKPYKKQLEIIDHVKNGHDFYNTVLSSRQVGKSYMNIILTIEYLLLGKRVLYISPDYSNNATIYDEMFQFIPDSIIYSKHKSRNIVLKTGGFVKFYTSNNINSVRGNTVDLVIIDEGAFIDNLSNKIGEVLSPTLKARQGKVLITSTPFGINDFTSILKKGFDNVSNYKSFKINVLDSPFTDLKFLIQQRNILPDRIFRQEYLAQILNSNNLFGENAHNCIIKELSKKPTKIYSCDVASLVDYTVIIGLDEDGHMTHYDRFQGPYSLIMDKLSKLDTSIPLRIDATGNVKLAEDVRNMRKGGTVDCFIFTNESKENIIYTLMKNIDNNTIGFNIECFNEMKVMTQKRLPSGRYKYEAKSGYNDDAVMSLAMAIDYLHFTRNQSKGFYKSKR